ncbi:hypothetical protein, unlikely [Trypanosoma brucei gambiense DAL972]|uniref:Uncharacterized protein n=1 Tax=Trypanosoma brucei gambiense (strain MHOM/CI/86/DAL972) TaxID=679716 RepID=C9ZP06_TRYB9|nr:hypothetical protein, unlikely [Trypanosoma brucei gambiense DAL972]CBH11134.1 hypothetical protein, unlikely [Trypanosoma brucei gambiense DAL972]|eukprot:XP_011773421.1 hypothetical protein, unlikely [Trypanosoma brucei gambiense DAL972]
MKQQKYCSLPPPTLSFFSNLFLSSSSSNLIFPAKASKRAFHFTASRGSLRTRYASQHTILHSTTKIYKHKNKINTLPFPSALFCFVLFLLLLSGSFLHSAPLVDFRAVQTSANEAHHLLLKRKKRK